MWPVNAALWVRRLAKAQKIRTEMGIYRVLSAALAAYSFWVDGVR